MEAHKYRKNRMGRPRGMKLWGGTVETDRLLKAYRIQSRVWHHGFHMVLASRFNIGSLEDLSFWSKR